MSKKTDPKSGRVAFDERGQPVWQWRKDSGEYSSDVDTRQVRKLQEDAGVTLKDEPAPPQGFDPYSTLGPSGPTAAPIAEPPRKGRRTLDDMRKLSEEIKRKRQEQQK